MDWILAAAYYEMLNQLILCSSKYLYRESIYIYVKSADVSQWNQTSCP